MAKSISLDANVPSTGKDGNSTYFKSTFIVGKFNKIMRQSIGKKYILFHTIELNEDVIDAFKEGNTMTMEDIEESFTIKVNTFNDDKGEEVEWNQLIPK